MEWNFIMDLELSGLFAQVECNMTQPKLNSPPHHIFIKYLNLKLFHSCQVSRIQFPNVVHPVTVLLTTHVNTTSQVCAHSKIPTLQHVQAELSHRPAMFWLATCIIRLIKQTIFGPPFITHTVKRTMLFGPLSTTALMYHTVNCFGHWLEHWYTFTVCQIWQVHATSIVVLHSLLRQLKQQ